MKPFRSFQNVPIVNQPEKPPTREEMAAELAEEMCLRYKEMRLIALAADQNAELPLVWSPEAQECITTLEALMKGPHGWVVKPVILEHFPELVRPPTEQEKQAVDEYISQQQTAAAKPQGPEYGTCADCGAKLEIAVKSCLGPHLYRPCQKCATKEQAEQASQSLP